ncbi:MAG: stress responsive alpha-beta barrel domain protein [Opitutae bacterium]|nr:stress responsive alpha-beta barrel domain protein [Opitutae bacterium]|tara:strand:+ start:436 stop:855 length:420 start_codon:yes stop_codon:yes gene_type:complete
MKQSILVAIVLLVAHAGLESSYAQTAEPKEKPKIKKKVKAKKIQHVVCFKFKDDASREQIKEVENAFAALKKKIPEIDKLEWGTNNSPEGLNKGFTHCFIVTFPNEKAREVYLPHPDHKAFVAILKPILDDVFVIDFAK